MTRTLLLLALVCAGCDTRAALLNVIVLHEGKPIDADVIVTDMFGKNGVVDKVYGGDPILTVVPLRSGRSWVAVSGDKIYGQSKFVDLQAGDNTVTFDLVRYENLSPEKPPCKDK